MIEKKHIKALFEKIKNIVPNQKNVEKKALDDYLLSKREKGQYQDYIISFDDEDDYVYFMKLLGNLGINLADISGT